MTGTVAARLSAQPFFAALTDSQRGALAEDGTAVTFTAGERLFDEGGVADMFWLIEQGGIALDMRVPGRGDQIVETLGPGTVLELDRKVGEAIDIYVNDRLVARGEVVLVEEKLGVTMTEIIKAERN